MVSKVIRGVAWTRYYLEIDQRWYMLQLGIGEVVKISHCENVILQEWMYSPEPTRAKLDEWVEVHLEENCVPFERALVAEIALECLKNENL